MKINISGLMEKCFLIVMFFILLYAGYSNLSDHKISHDFPYGYSASDSFQHQVRAEAIKEMGNFRYEAPYISMGLENVVGRYPPILYHLSVVLSHASGIETYDTIYFIVFFFTALSAILMYFIIRRFNKNVAILSLPLTILLFAFRSYGGFTWGHWPSILSQFFLIAFCWAISNIDLKRSFIFISVFSCAIALTHTSELIFGIIFLAIFFIIKLVFKDIKKKEILSLIYSGIISFVLSIYYLIIFQNTWAKAQPFSFGVMARWDNNPALYLSDFGIILWVVMLGVLLSVFMVKKKIPALIIGLSMLIIGFGNYVGFNTRSFQLRFFWPIYLSIFFGLSLFYLVKLTNKKIKSAYCFGIAVIFIIIFIGVIKIPMIPSYNKIPANNGLMDSYHWEMLSWFEDNSKPDDRVYFFYGDIFGQDALLRNCKRVHYQVDPNDYVDALQKREIRREYVTETPGDGGGSLGYRETFFKFRDYSGEVDREFFIGKKDICNFRYLVFDKASRQPVLAQYNILIASKLLEKDYIDKVFENEYSVILINNNIGDDCIEEGSF